MLKSGFVANALGSWLVSSMMCFFCRKIKKQDVQYVEILIYWWWRIKIDSENKFSHDAVKCVSNVEKIFEKKRKEGRVTTSSKKLVATARISSVNMTNVKCCR